LQRYEVIVIVLANLNDEDITALIERSQTIITDRKGVIAKIDKWGKRHLAYEIKKQKDGFFTYQGFNRNLKNLTIPLQGDHQLSNAALALAAIELCEKNGFSIADTAISAGLKNTYWEARLEVLQNQPLFLLDGAHNPAGISVLCRSFKKGFSYRRLILIFGALADNCSTG